MTQDATLTVASYNVHGFIGRDGRFDPRRVVDVIARLDADIVALQEVEHRVWEGVPVVEWLGNRLDMGTVRGDAFRRGQFNYGNVILTRHTPEAVARHDLSVANREPRSAVELFVTLKNGSCRFIGSHLGLRARERRQQLAQLAALVEKTEDAFVVVAADFNEWRPRYRPERQLGQGFHSGPAHPTFPASRPMVALDRICVRPATAMVGIEVVSDPETRVASDHLPLVATLLQPVMPALR